MRGLVHATALLLVAMTSGCTDDGPSTAEATTTTDQRVEFCEAYEAMLDAQQQWTVEYLNSLTPEERVENRAEQEAVAAPVEELMPDSLAEAWDELVPVGEAIDVAIAAITPVDGTTEDLLREVRAQGFGSLAEYVMRDGLVVDGETWTFDRYVAAGAEQAEQAAAYCATSP